MRDKGRNSKIDESNKEDELEPGQLKPKNEGINNTDIPNAPFSKRALNNPTGQNEDLSGGGADPLADL
jgi:hypothetical protein